MNSIKTLLVVALVGACSLPALADKAMTHKKAIERGLAAYSAEHGSLRGGASCEEAETIVCGGTDVDNTLGEFETYYAFTLTAASDVTIDLSAVYDDGDLDLYLVNGDCTAELGESATYDDNEQIVVNCLAAGDYKIRIDNWDVVEMDFTLGLTCTECVVEPDPCEPFLDAVAISCGDVVQGTTLIDCESSISTYSCVSWNEGGPEVAYVLTTTADMEITAAITNLSADLDVFILASADPADCIAYNNATAVTDCVTAGTYYIMVDGYGTAASDFTLTVTCEECGGVVEPCEPFLNATPIACGDVVTGNNGGCEGVISDYGIGYAEIGPEVAYSFELLTAAELTIALSGMSADLDAYLSPAATPTAAIAYGDNSFTTTCLDPGSYYIIVDGYDGAISDFTLTLTCNDCGVVEDPCDDLVCTDIVLVDGHWETLGSNVGAPDVYGTTAGDVCFSLTLAEPTAIEINTYFAGTDFDTDSYYFWNYMPCDDEYDEATNYLGCNDGLYAEDFATHVLFDCDGMLPAGTYYVLISGYESASGNFELHVDVVDCNPAAAVETPVDFALSQNYPNPFNPTTNIEFTVETGMVNLAVYNLAGQQVATLVNGMVESGTHTVTFDASNLTSGVYFYTLSANGQVATHKMVLVR